MSRTVTFTQAQIRRAVKAAESAGLSVKRIMVKQDGSIVVDSGEFPGKAIDSKTKPLPGWEDA